MYRAGLVTRSALLKGAYAQLVYLLLGADQQARVTRRRETSERLEQQRGLADAGLAAEERDRARHEAASQHAIELGDARGPRRGARGGHLADGHRPLGRRERHRRRRGDLLDERVPRAASAAPTLPPGRGVPALAAPVQPPRSHTRHRRGAL